MTISEIHILPTSNTPEYHLDPNGFIKIKGRGLMGANSEVSKVLMNWIDIYLKDPADTTYVILAFEYLNSFSTTILVSILKELRKVETMNKKFIIHWYHEEDDDDILERGEFISGTFNMPIEFLVTNDISVCG